MLMEITKASMADVEGMKALIEVYARQDKMLARSLSYLYDNIRDYFVMCDGGLLVGCCALHVCWSDLAEIKSLAVHPERQNQGVGRGLLAAAISEAKAMGIPRVFTLTREPEFFLRNGFREVGKDKLPMKIWGECVMCPKYPECDETALEYLVT